MIVGHTVAPNAGKQGLLRGMIFSFHMPLFFLLSGMTTKLSGDAEQFLRRTEKSFKRLIIPVLVTYFLICLVNIYKYGIGSDLKQYLADIVNTLVYASGVTVDSVNAPALGALWFLVALFLGRTMYDYMAFRLRKNLLYAICIVAALAGICFGKVQWLPFSFDIVLAIMPFLMMGQIAREKLLTSGVDGGFGLSYRVRIRKSRILMLAACIAFATIWIILFFIIYKSKGQYFELAIRRYPLPVISYLCALFGIAAVCTTSALVINLKHISRTLIYLGNQSMIVYLIHVVDGWWYQIWGFSPNVGVRIMLRAVIDIVFALAITLTINKIELSKKKKADTCHE